MWNTAALHLLGILADQADGADQADDEVAAVERFVRQRLPAAVVEWFRAGADRRLAQLSDNQVTTVASLSSPDHDRFLDRGLLLLETDSQYCCRWITPLGAGDDPVVYLIDPDDFAGESRTPYAARFTAYTEVDVWDALLFRTQDAAWSFDHELRPDVFHALDAVLDRRPSTYGWAHNQGCDAIHRFDGSARVAIAVRGSMAVWTIMATPDPARAAEIADIIGIPPEERP